MLGSANIYAVIAVKDLEAAKKFYGGTLGLEQASEHPGGAVVYKTGDTMVQVYQSSLAGTNQATTASWKTDDVEGVVAALEGKGIAFEHYDSMPGVERDGSIHRMGPMTAAWFKDPDGNILCVANLLG